jgi:hypothetical protein
VGQATQVIPLEEREPGVGLLEPRDLSLELLHQLLPLNRSDLEIDDRMQTKLLLRTKLRLREPTAPAWLRGEKFRPAD